MLSRGKPTKCFYLAQADEHISGPEVIVGIKYDPNRRGILVLINNIKA